MRATRAIVAVAVLFAAGCAYDVPEPGEGPTGSPTTSASPTRTSPTRTTAPPTTTTATTTPSTPPSQSEIVLRGQVEAGIEAGCLVLSTDRGQYLLLGGDRTVLQAGTEVVVEGTPRPDQVTTCQQGTPFSVTSARAEG